MKKSILFLAALCLTLASTITAQEKYDDMVNVGDELLIGSPSDANYKFIAMPRKNFIIKKGGIANMNSIVNNKVVITRKTYGKNDEVVVTFKKANGGKFFNAYRTLKADLNGAISNGELRFKNSSASGEIAK
jgi:hypothetical protein